MKELFKVFESHQMPIETLALERAELARWKAVKAFVDQKVGTLQAKVEKSLASMNNIIDPLTEEDRILIERTRTQGITREFREEFNWK